MTELQLLAEIRRRAGRTSGIGDDCAVVPLPPASQELLVTTDLLLEDVHFRRATHSPQQCGHKALARGLSDIAAMGGMPLYCLVSLAVPNWADRKWVRGFYSGLLRLASRTRTQLAGGDLARDTRFACDIVVVGVAPRGKALRRDGAFAGDAIYVSGALGGSALGMNATRGAAWRRHRLPEPRLGLGLHLRGKATACMDLSDGLSLDLHRLCLASGLAAIIDRPLPVFHGATLDHALHGGEDYELLFTARPSRKIPSYWRELPLTRIGSIVKGRPGHISFFGRKLAPMGYDHFRTK